MIRKGILALVLTALPLACGSGQGSKLSQGVPRAYAAEPATAKVAADTGAAVDTTRRTDALRSDSLPTGPAAEQRGQGQPGATGDGVTGGGGMMSGGGMMGGRGMRGGRMGMMMGGRGGQAPAASAEATADTGACPQITQALVDAGRQIFTGRGNCATCHGANGKGGPLAPNLTDTTWLDTNGSYTGIAGIVRSGVAQPKQHPAPMPPMGGASLSATQICDVAGYVYSLSHKP